MIAKTDDKTFIEMIEAVGIQETMRKLGYSTPRAVYKRRERLEAKIGRQIKSPNRLDAATRRATLLHPDWLERTIANGVVLVGSDAHYWPGIITTAHMAFVLFCKKISPHTIIMNGDVFDGSSISRFPPIGWEKRPALVQEIEACKERLGEIEAVRGNAELLWPLGNHDGRFETRLATVAPEYAKVHGVHLKDHFPYWKPCWAININGHTVIKHRFKGGIHAIFNNVRESGMNIVTSHRHAPNTVMYSDYNGIRYGNDTGTLANPYGPQFESYTEQNPLNHRSAFTVLTFKDKELLPPETVLVLREGVVAFRGELINV